jgi:hypothetical protein
MVGFLVLDSNATQMSAGRRQIAQGTGIGVQAQSTMVVMRPKPPT